MTEEEKAKMQALEAEVFILRHLTAGLTRPPEDYFSMIAFWHRDLLNNSAKAVGGISDEAQKLALNIPNRLYRNEDGKGITLAGIARK